ncbi:hypothetical protein GGI12_005781 [Dipsacomyces acuminosporus]|nr:hypothetical protein GGI12_005781 [Dipsacomyces acuminosporus]
MVGGHYIPGGYEVNLNISAANLNKDYWQTPYLYDPTRFLSNDDAKRSIFTFGVGVRVCPGRQLAWVELLTILANILKDYDLRLPDDYKHRGPHVLDERGYPKLLDSLNFFVNVPADSDRDCRILVSKRQ